MFSRRKPAPPPMPAQPEPQAQLDYFRLGGMRLFQPDPALAERLPNGVSELAAYCKTLAWVGTEYFGRLGRDFGSLGVLIVVGIRPGRQIKLWCDPVDGQISDDVWDVFVDLLAGAGANVRPEVTAPVAVALECLIGHGPGVEFPMIPAAWQRAAASSAEPLGVPDGIFEIVFPAESTFG